MLETRVCYCWVWPSSPFSGSLPSPPDPPSPDCFLRYKEMWATSKGNQFHVSCIKHRLGFHLTQALTPGDSSPCTGSTPWWLCAWLGPNAQQGRPWRQSKDMVLCCCRTYASKQAIGLKCWEAKSERKACSKSMFPQKWIMCVLYAVWSLNRISALTTYLMIILRTAGRYTEHRNCTDILKEGGKVINNSVQGVK